MAASADINRLQLSAIWRRRRWPMLIVIAIVLLASMVAAFVWPPTYVSTATVLIEQQEVPVDLVRSAITSFADQRIQMINQRVMSSEKLLGIVQKYDLYAKERKRRGREKILDMMRTDIKFGSIKASVIDPRQGRPVEATIAFSLSYQSRSPETAARVANNLWDLYQQENLQSRKRQADETTTFLTAEADGHNRRIGELTAQIATFKREHINTLPEVAGLNLQRMSRADDEKSDVDTQLRTLDQTITILQAQLSQTSKVSPFYDSTGTRAMSPADRRKFLQSELSRATAGYAPDHPTVLRLKREIEGLAALSPDPNAENERQRQLQEARTGLITARQRYEPDHPEVKKMERLVATLSEPTAANDTASPAGSQQDTPDNPAYIQLKAQIDAAQAERSSLQRKRDDLVQRVSELEARLATTPGVEKDYMTLARELDSTQLKYREARQKQMEAQSAQNLETESKGERFTLIDPPVAPEEPASPNRRLILVSGLALALALAAGLAVLLEALDQRIRGRNDVAGLLTVPPLAVIPWLENAAQRALRIRQQRLMMLGSVVAVALAVVGIHFLYRPLDVLWAIALRRLGS